MDDKTKIIIALVVALILGLPLLANLAGEKKTEPAAAPVPEGHPPLPPGATGIPPAPAPQPQAAPQAQPQPVVMPPPPPPRPAGPPPPISLANTAWTFFHPQAGNVTVQFFANGTALAQSDKLPMQVEGTWSQNGGSVSLMSPMGNTTGQLNGDQMIVMGNAARRLR